MTTRAPFTGGKISLISKAEIRYEGILYQVDTKESTVTLAKGEIRYSELLLDVFISYFYQCVLLGLRTDHLRNISHLVVRCTSL